MRGLIDIHSHILPSVDDGSRSLEQSMNMVRIAYREGIGQIIATPHFFVHRFEYSPKELISKLEMVKNSIRREMPEMKLHLGCEIMYTSDIAELIADGKVLSMCDSRYVLVEFMPGVTCRELKDGIHNVSLSGKIPIIAHVERYQAVMDDIYFIDDLKELGACIQVNAGSVVGDLGRNIKKNIKLLMKEELIDFVATDCHSDGHRAPYLEKCARYISRKFDEDYMEKLLIKNPQKIIDNKYI